MAIPESQLDTWSHQGSITQSSNTYQTIRNALLSPNALYADKAFDVFLQGSYGNDTNIYADSDVDVVIRLDSIYRGDISALPPDQRAAYNQAFSAATYSFDEFKQGALTRLRTAFDENDVTPDNKAIKLKANGSRRNADVVVCYEYRRYIRFISPDNYAYIPGIVFPSARSGDVINYPKRHSTNCTEKHQASNAWFKPVVRILKNMRNKLIDGGMITEGTAPSYYLEGLIHNVPSELFGVNYSDSVRNCLNWLWAANRGVLMCAHGQHQLLGTSNVQWSSANCDEFLGAAIELWNGWQ